MGLTISLINMVICTLLNVTNWLGYMTTKTAIGGIILFHHNIPELQSKTELIFSTYFMKKAGRPNLILTLHNKADIRDCYPLWLDLMAIQRLIYCKQN